MLITLILSASRMEIEKDNDQKEEKLSPYYIDCLITQKLYGQYSVYISENKRRTFVLYTYEKYIPICAISVLCPENISCVYCDNTQTYHLMTKTHVKCKDTSIYVTNLLTNDSLLVQHLGYPDAMVVFPQKTQGGWSWITKTNNMNPNQPFVSICVNVIRPASLYISKILQKDNGMYWESTSLFAGPTLPSPKFAVQRESDTSSTTCTMISNHQVDVLCVSPVLKLGSFIVNPSLCVTSKPDTNREDYRSVIHDYQSSKLHFGEENCFKQHLICQQGHIFRRYARVGGKYDILRRLDSTCTICGTDIVSMFEAKHNM